MSQLLASVPNSDQKRSSENFRERISNYLLDNSLKSPLLLLSRSAVEENYRLLKNALPRADIHYAIKSNNHDSILQTISNCGGNFDVCSAKETEQAISTGIKPATLVHSHPIKSIEEFDSAIQQGVNVFVVDNPDEIEKLKRYPKETLNILIRFRVNTDAKAVVDLQYKYGCTESEVLPLAKKIKEAGQNYYGLCFHIGSQCIHTENYIKAIEASKNLIEQLKQNGLETKLLDIGGGYPVEYTEKVPSITEICNPINKALEAIDQSIKIVCEPGRFISANAVTLITTVNGRAIRDGIRWYYLDDGLYSTFSGSVYDQCQYPVVHNYIGETKNSVLAGPTCDSFDVITKSIALPELSIGDRLAFPMTGAYCAVSGSSFNSLRKAEYLIVD